MDQRNLYHFENLLKDRLIRAQDAFDMTEENGFKDSLRNSIEELSTYDNHPADIGTETFEMEKNFALQGHEVHQIQQIKHALNKIHDGSYGICDLCGNEISMERLEALPQANLCIDCEKETKTNPKFLENDRSPNLDVLDPPFGRTFNNGTDKNEYDGEDALQDVQRYGSSDSPQDISVNRYINYENLFLDSDEDPGADVEDVDKITNDQYKAQVPEGHVTVILNEPQIDYEGDGKGKKAKKGEQR